MSSSPPMSALDNLRTVEFRQTLRGYHIDDVDEYLERVAVEAEALQEQFRQLTDRLRHASDRIAELESQRSGDATAVAVPRADVDPSPADTEALQRTLLLAQKFVDQTQAEAEAQARTLVDDAQQRARVTVAEAEAEARTIVEGAEARLREEVARLEALRIKLVGDVETVSTYLDAERGRLRGMLGDMLRWVDENVQPTANLGGRSGDATGTDPSPSGSSASGGQMAAAPAEPAGGPERQALMTVRQGASGPNGITR